MYACVRGSTVCSIVMYGITIVWPPHAVTDQVLLLQTTGLGARVLGLQLLVGPTQVLNRDLCVAHPDQLQHRIVNEYVLTLERESIMIGHMSGDSHVMQVK